MADEMDIFGAVKFKRPSADDYDVQYPDDATVEFLDYEEKKKRLGEQTRHPIGKGAGSLEEYRPPGVINEPSLTLGKIAAASGIGALSAFPFFRAAQGARAVASSIPRGVVTKAGELYRYLRGRPIPEPRMPRPEYHVPPRADRTQARIKPDVRTRKKPKNPTEAELQAYREGTITREELYHRSTFKKGGAVKIEDVALRGMFKSSRKKNIDGRAIQGKTKTKYF